MIGMIGTGGKTRALRRPAALLALLAALAAGLFASLGTVAAADAGNCTNNGYLVVGDDCRLGSANEYISGDLNGVLTLDEDDNGTYGDGADDNTDDPDRLRALSVGSVTFAKEVGPNPGDAAEMTLHVIADQIMFGTLSDGDGIFAAGDDVDLTITIRGVVDSACTPTSGVSAAESEVWVSSGFNLMTFNSHSGGNSADGFVAGDYAGLEVDYVEEIGLYLACGTNPVRDVDDDGTNETVTVVNNGSTADVTFQGPSLDTTHLPEGSYSLQIRLTDGTGNDNVVAGLPNGYQANVFFTIGTPGQTLSSISYGLQDGESATTAGGEKIGMQVSSFNSLGNAVSRNDISQVTVIATGGSITGQVIQSDGTTASQTVTNSAQLGGAPTVQWEIGSIGGVAATVDVYVIVSPVDGSASPPIISDTIRLKFTGGLASLSVPNKTESAGLTTTLAITGADMNGDPVTLADDDDIRATVTTAGGASAGTATYKDISTADGHQPGIEITWANAAPPSRGQYTVTANIGGDAATAVSVTVTVTGDTANVDVQLDTSAGTSLGSILVVTATLTDADGNLVGPTEVDVTVSGGLVLVGSGKMTENGVLTRNVVVTDASKLGTVTVASDDTNVTGVAVFNPLAAPAEEEAAVEDPGIDGLSGLSGFASWQSAFETSASALFGELSSRGASALLLWDSPNSQWVRYSVIGGVAVPGSTDFAITEWDIVFISY